jgi:hypothetical protein
MQRAPRLPDQLAQGREVNEPIGFFPETRHAVHAALPDVERHARHDQPPMSRHDGSTPTACLRLTITTLTPN